MSGSKLLSLYFTIYTRAAQNIDYDWPVDHKDSAGRSHTIQKQIFFLDVSLLSLFRQCYLIDV